MTTPQKTIYNCETGETITRDFTDDETAQLELEIAQNKKDAAAKLKADQAVADKRQMILDRLGLTTDEFQTLIS